MFNQFYQLANRLVLGQHQDPPQYDQLPPSFPVQDHDDDDDAEHGHAKPAQQQRKPRSSSIKGGDDPVILGTMVGVDSNSKFLNMLGNMKQHASDFNLQALTESVTSMQERTAQQVQTRFPLLGGPFWACIFYSVVSTSMILVNKLLLTTYEFKYPMVLMFHQNLMTVNSLYLAKQLGITTYEPLEHQKVMRWLPMDVFFVIMLLTGFYSVQLLSVPMVTIFKNTNNIFIACGDALFFGNIPSQGVIWTMLLMLLAAVMAALNDLEYTAVGYMWTLGNCLASTSFVLYAQSAIARTNLSTFGKVYYNNVLALPLVLIADVLVFNDFKRLFTQTDAEDLIKFLTVDFIFLWFLSGILGFLQSLSSLKAQQLTGPTTYSMVGSLNKIPLTFMGIWIFNSPMTPKGLLYVSLSILAGGLYSYTKAKEEIALRAEKQAAAQDQKVRRDEQQMKNVVLGGEMLANNVLSEQEGAHLRHHHHRPASTGKKSRSMPSPMVDADQVIVGSGGNKL